MRFRDRHLIWLLVFGWCMALVIWIVPRLFQEWQHCGSIAILNCQKVQLRPIHCAPTEREGLTRGIWKTVIVRDRSGYHNLLMAASQIRERGIGHIDHQINWLGSDYCLNLYRKPVVTDKIGSLYRSIGVGNVERSRVNNYLNGSARQSSNVLQRNREDFAVIFQCPITHDKNSSFRNMQDLFSSLGRKSCLRSNNFRLVGLIFHAVGKVFRTVSLPSGSINLPLHFYERFRQCIPVVAQGLMGQSVSPSDLRPLESSKYGVDDEDKDTKYLQNKFGVVAPFVGLLIGCGTAGWGWWRIRRPNNWRQLGAGTVVLVSGFTLGVIAGCVFVIVAFP